MQHIITEAGQQENPPLRYVWRNIRRFSNDIKDFPVFLLESFQNKTPDQPNL